ncbi:DUF1232 domain-containing protein [uncultured Megasphaera sp.]
MRMWKLLSFFARFYTPGKFIRFIRGTGRRLHFLPKLMTIFYCMQDKDTPKFVKLALMGALGYVILPLDLVSDAFIGIGWLDDAAVVAAALRLAGTYVKPEHLEKVRRMFPFANV